MSDDDWFERALREDEDPDVSLPEDVAKLDSEESTEDDSAFNFETSSREPPGGEPAEEGDPFALGAAGSSDASASSADEEGDESMFDEDFESALDTSGPSESEASGSDSTGEDDPFALGAAEPSDSSANEGGESGEESMFDEGFESALDTSGPSESEASGSDTAEEDDPFALGAVESSDTSTSSANETGETGDESMFGEDFESALGASGPAESGSADPDTAEEDDPFALGAEQAEESDDGDSLFDEDFSSALEGVDVPGEAGIGGEASGMSFDIGGSDTDFEEELDTELPRIDLGIEGLDRMIHGGVPERTLITAIGEAGTGKTTFGLQFLDHGLSQGENAVFITLEETRERVINSATEKGYPFDEYEQEGSLAVVDVDPVEMANSLSSIQNELPVLIEEFGASRLVLDSVSLLEMMYEDRAKRRNEIFDFARSLKEAGVTAMLTSEASEDTPHASRYRIVEYLTDAVFVLQYIRPDDFQETRMAIEIQKIRDANHSREKKPYEITGEGISVYQQANLF